MRRYSILLIFILSCLPVVLYGQGLRFEVKFKGEILQNEQKIEIRDYKKKEDAMMMIFDPEVTNISSSTYGMILIKEEVDVLVNTQNTLCWDQCMSSDALYATSSSIEPGVTQKPYGDFQLNYQGDPIIGTSVVKYTFMTNDPEDIALSVEVNFIYEGSATMQKEGSVLTLGGHWQTTDFDSLDLSDSLLTAVDMTGITIPGEVSILKAANPNVLFYIAENATVPTNWNNVIKGDSAGNIFLTDGFAFRNKKAFKAQSVSYNRDFNTSAWTTGCIPFEVTELPEGIKAGQVYELINTDIHFKDTFALSANTPYLFHTEKPGSYTFKATDVTVPVTKMEEARLGNYTFRSTLQPLTLSEDSAVFSLNGAGTTFTRIAQTTGLVPFRAYIQLIHPDEELLNIGVIHHGEVAVTENSTDRIQPEVWVDEGRLLVRISKSQIVYIYNTKGSLQQELFLMPGIHAINNLMKGVYIVSGKKVVL